MSHEHDNHAWQLENAARHLSPSSADIARESARQIRQDDIHNKIVELFARGDEQNKIIDIGLKAGKLPEL